MIDEQTAAREFERLCALRRITLDPNKMTKREAEALAAQRVEVESAICEGLVEIDDSGKLTYRLLEPVEFGSKTYESLTFKKPKGSTYLAMDGFGEKESFARIFAIAASLTGVSLGALHELENADFTFVTTLVNLFLG